MRLKTLDRDKTYLLYCRSGQALALMEKLGLERVAHIAGGIVAWRYKGYALFKAEAVNPDLLSAYPERPS